MHVVEGPSRRGFNLMVFPGKSKTSLSPVQVRPSNLGERHVNHCERRGNDQSLHGWVNDTAVVRRCRKCIGTNATRETIRVVEEDRKRRHRPLLLERATRFRWKQPSLVVGTKDLEVAGPQWGLLRPSLVVLS